MNKPMISKLPRGIAALILSSLAFYSLNTYLHSLPNSFSKKANLANSTRNPSIVVLGSSHTLFGIRPNYLPESAVNLANVSQSLELDEQLLEKYLAKGNRPKVIIVPISYFSLDFRLTNTVEEWRDCFYHEFLGISERGQLSCFYDRRYWGLSTYFSARDLWRIGKTRSLNAKVPYAQLDAFGWQKPEGIGDISDSAARARVSEQHQFMHASAESDNLKALKHIVERANEAGAGVVFVTTPVCPNYRRWINCENFLRHQVLVRELCQDKAASLASYFSDPRFDADDFADTDHLNSHGAAKFTRILWNEQIHERMSAVAFPCMLRDAH